MAANGSYAGKICACVGVYVHGISRLTTPAAHTGTENRVRAGCGEQRPWSCVSICANEVRIRRVRCRDSLCHSSHTNKSIFFIFTLNLTNFQNSALHYIFKLRNRWVKNNYTVIFIQLTRDFGDFCSGMSTMRSQSCNILHSCRVCFASTSGRSGFGISRCKHYLVLGAGHSGKVLGLEVCSSVFVLLNSLECAYWDGAIFERRGMVWFARVTLQSRWWLYAIWRIPCRARWWHLSTYFMKCQTFYMHCASEW